MPDDVSWQRGLFCTALALMALGATAMAEEFNLPPKTYYRTASVLGHRIFYREAGDPAKSTIVLVHGFPASSHSYRELIPMLARDYHVIAPDYLGSGYSAAPIPTSSPTRSISSPITWKACSTRSRSTVIRSTCRTSARRSGSA
jgi:hypothetical protein